MQQQATAAEKRARQVLRRDGNADAFYGGCWSRCQQQLSSVQQPATTILLGI
jgi:hypothetical protein